jgi:hypothetical protein
LTQPADIGLFQPLKKAYSDQVNSFIKASITYIGKTDFLVGFKEAFKQAITSSNAKAGFRGAGLVPFNPQEVILKMDIRLRSPSSTTGSSPPWSSHTPHNPKEALSQTHLVRDGIARHQSSSPTPLFRSIEALAKGTERLAHEMAILRADNQRLHKANHDLSKRRKAPKIYLKRNEAITTEETNKLLAQKEVVDKIEGNIAVEGGESQGASSTQSRCGICKQPGHNKRTCPNRLIDPTLVTST